jgi:hypothetical protein
MEEISCIFALLARYQKIGAPSVLAGVLPVRENLNVDHILVVGGLYLVELFSWIGELYLNL